MEEARASLEELEGLEGAVVLLLRQRRTSARSGTVVRRICDYRISKLLEAVEISSSNFIHDEKSTWQRVQSDRSRIEAMDDPLHGFAMDAMQLRVDAVKFPDAVGLKDRNMAQTCKARFNQEPTFSGEEKWGKFVDMTLLHLRFVRLPNIKMEGLKYIDYLDKCGNLFVVPLKCKSEKHPGISC